MVVDRLGEQVDDALLAASAVDGTDVLLGEHGAVFLRLLVLHGDQHVVQALDLKTRSSREGSSVKVVTSYKWMNKN